MTTIASPVSPPEVEEAEEKTFEAKKVPSRLSRFGEFLLVGGLTIFLFPLSLLIRAKFGLESSELAVGFTAFYAASIINDPHFSVTYLLFYKNIRKRAFGGEYSRAQRVRYWISGLVVPAALITWGVLALVHRSAEGIGWMVQLMFLLVGWHYVKQGFGMFVVLCARHGSRVTPRERIVLLTHCFAGWAFAWSNPSMPANEFEEKGVVYHAIAHPRLLEIATGSIFALSTIALGAMLVRKWLRSRGDWGSLDSSGSGMFPIAPLAGLLITIWSWTIFSNIDPLLRYVIPGLHSIQYLYFVWLMKKNEARSQEGPPNFGRPVAVRIGFLALTAIALAWFLFKGAPAFLDSSVLSRSQRVAGTRDLFDAMGDTPYFAVIYVIVNVHHYFMDYVIWRRENPETRYLQAS